MTTKNHTSPIGEDAANGAIEELRKLPWLDNSTADPVEKARRVLMHLIEPSLVYYFEDGFPRPELKQQASNCLAVLNALASKPGTANGAIGEREAFGALMKGVPCYAIDRFGVEHVAEGGGWIKESELYDAFVTRAALIAQNSFPLSVEQKAALDLAVLNLKTHGDDQLLAAVKPIIECYERAALPAEKVAAEPVAVRTHTTQPGESVMGIALRQCGNEAEWRHILACNPKFADLLPNDYFPVGTVLTLPATAQPVSGGKS